MKNKTIYCILSIVIVIALIVIATLSTCVYIYTPKDLSEFISLDNISKINISTSVPEEFNKKFNFDLKSSEIDEFIKLVKNASVTRVLGENEFDMIGYVLTITYEDGSLMSIPYRNYIKLNDKWYKVHGFVFEYIYETESYKLARELA